MNVVIAGATGLVGKAIVDRLAKTNSIHNVFALNRNEKRKDGNVHWLKADFDRLEDLNSSISKVDIAICALGATIKKAGSQEAFRKVDVEYPEKFGEWTKSRGAKQYILISAIGADTSAMFFYSRCKGEVEERIMSLKFESTVIMRPSTLLGDRGEFRLGEEIAKFLSPITPQSFAPVHASTIATEVEKQIGKLQNGVIILESSEIGA